MENFFPIAPGNLRTLYGKGVAVYTAPVGKTVKYFYPFNISKTTYHFIVLNDGTAFAVNITTLAVTTITATANTFYAATGLPQAAQWGNQFLLIVTPAAANGYFIWDGTTLYSPGGAAPAAFGGTMPTGISGTGIEVFQNRAIIVNGNKFLVSAPSNPVDFATADGGVTVPSTDNFLKAAFTAVKQSNGFLYPWGDSSINVISNISTSGSPATTTFTNANTDPQVGTSWRDTIQPFGRSLVFANVNGVYILIGGAAEKISEPLDGIFASATLPFTGDQVPSAAVATIFGIKCYILLMDTLDPFTGTHRNMMYLWNGQKWFQGSQETTPIYVSAQEINSLLTSWGTDGNTIFSLFATPSSTLSKKVQSKLWSGSGIIVRKKSLRLYTEATDNSAAGSGVTLNYTLDNEVVSVPVAVTQQNTLLWTGADKNIFTWTGSDLKTFLWTIPGLSVQGQNVDSYGLALGLTITSTSPDFSLVSSILLYRDDQIYA